MLWKKYRRMQQSPLFKFETFNLSHPILKFQIFLSHGNRCASATQSVRGPFSKRSSFSATLKPFRGPSWGDCDFLFGQLDQLPRCLHIFQRGSKARFQQVWPLTIFFKVQIVFDPLWGRYCFLLFLPFGFWNFRDTMPLFCVCLKKQAHFTLILDCEKPKIWN